jgi:hypothetical protein
VKRHRSALCTLALLAGRLPSLLAQGSQPTQPVDPTAQAPAARAPTTPPTFPTSKAKAQPDRSDVRVYTGSIVKKGGSYVLKSGNEKYLLDSQQKAKNYQGKDVEITGALDKGKNLIHIEQIKVSPSN